MCCKISKGGFEMNNIWNNLKSGQGGLEFVILMYIFMFTLAIAGMQLGWWID